MSEPATDDPRPGQTPPGDSGPSGPSGPGPDEVPSASPTRSTSFRVVTGAAALTIVLAGLRAASSICLPLLLALFLTILFLPLLRSLRRRGVPTAVAILVTMLTVAAVLTLVGMVLSASVDAVTEELPAYTEQLTDQLDRLTVWLEGRGVDTEQLRSAETVDLGAIMQFAGSTFRGLATVLSSSLLVLLTMVFMLWESVILPSRLEALDRVAPGIDLRRLAGVVGRVQRYLILKTLISLATGVSIGVAVYLLGLDFALLWGFLAFLLNYIPSIGSVVASIPAVLLALADLGPTRALVVALIYLVVNIVFGNLIEPAVMGQGLRLSPLAIFVALVFWGWLWGPLGMILSVPLTASLKIFFENTDDLRWAAILLDRKPRMEAREQE